MGSRCLDFPRPVTRFFVFLTVGALAALGLTALDAPEPAAAAPDTNKVLVVGDSVAYGVGCLLGDSGGNPLALPGDCPAQAGFKTKNAYQGACTIALGNVLGYDGNQYESGCKDWQTYWKSLIDAPSKPYELVVLNTGGWEFVDRWIGQPPAGAARNWSPPPNYQWGNPDNFAKAANRYAKKLRKAISVLSSRGAIVLVMNSLYVDPPVPALNVYFEAYGPDQPLTWSPPSTGVTFRPSEYKVEQFNAIQKLVVKEFPSSQARIFDFQGPFSLPGGDADGREYASQVSVNPAATSPGHPCGFLEILTCVSPRQVDGLHLSPGGHSQVLAPFLIPKVRSILKV